MSGLVYDNYRMLEQRPVASSYFLRHNEPIYFRDVPGSFVTQVSRRLVSEPDYLICCYKTYQMTSIPTALYIKKALSYKETKTFSITDMGSLSPMIALEWSRITKSRVQIVCLEQIYSEYREKDEKHNQESDALAMFLVGDQPDKYQLISYEHQWLKKSNFCPVENIAAATRTLIDTHLNILRISKDDVTVVPQMRSAGYIKFLQNSYPNIYTRSSHNNLSTADPFYSLADDHVEKLFYTPYYVLTFAEDTALGIVVLRNV